MTVVTIMNTECTGSAQHCCSAPDLAWLQNFLFGGWGSGGMHRSANSVNGSYLGRALLL